MTDSEIEDLRRTTVSQRDDLLKSSPTVAGGTVYVGSGDGTLTCGMGRLGVTDDELESYFRPAIRLLEDLVPHASYYHSTSQEFLNTDNPTELSDDHILILSDAVDPAPHSNGTP